MLFAQNLSCQATLAPRLRVAETELQIQLSYYLVPKTKHLLIVKLLAALCDMV